MGRPTGAVPSGGNATIGGAVGGGEAYLCVLANLCARETLEAARDVQILPSPPCGRVTTEAMTMSQGRACQWPDGCNRGALREVDTAPIGHPGRRWLCLRHAGRVWNARKRANRDAGRCPCGAAPTPGFKTCETCRRRDTDSHRRGRRLTELARSCGLTLPRQGGRRDAFLSAFRVAHGRSPTAERAGHGIGRCIGAG